MVLFMIIGRSQSPPAMCVLLVYVRSAFLGAVKQSADEEDGVGRER